MVFLPHLLSVLRAGTIEACISWGTPLVFRQGSDRKEMTRRLEQSVRSLKTAHDAQTESDPVQAAWQNARCSDR
jgi:lyso-ornithine lipid O-acyltransferase